MSSLARILTIRHGPFTTHRCTPTVLGGEAPATGPREQALRSPPGRDCGLERLGADPLAGRPVVTRGAEVQRVGLLREVLVADAPRAGLERVAAGAPAPVVG